MQVEVITSRGSYIWFFCSFSAGYRKSKDKQGWQAPPRCENSECHCPQVLKVLPIDGRLVSVWTWLVVDSWLELDCIPALFIHLFICGHHWFGIVRMSISELKKGGRKVEHKSMYYMVGEEHSYQCHSLMLRDFWSRTYHLPFFSVVHIFDICMPASQ